MQDKGTKETPQQQQSFQRVDDFWSAYANHVFLENSFWDLKLVFGQLDQSVTPPVTEQHTAITLPWAQVKILSYLLRAHLAGFEIVNGKVKLPASLIPPEIVAPTEETKAAEPNAPEIYEAIKKLRDELIASS